MTLSINKQLMALLIGVGMALPVVAGNNKCEFGGKWPNCNPPPVQEEPAPPSGGDNNANANASAGAIGAGLGLGVGYAAGGDASAQQGQAQGQSQGINDSGNSASVSGAAAKQGQSQGIHDSGNSASVSGAAATQGQSIGDTTSSSVSAGGHADASTSNAGNSQVAVDASDRSSTHYEAQALYLPTIQTAAPALVAGPTLVVDRGVCGPRQAKRQERVTGTYVGLVKRSTIDLGVDDELVPADEPYRYWTDPQGVTHVFGHQVVTFASVNGVAASRALGLGGGKTGGDWGQAGASSGSSVQRTILRIQLQECELPLQSAPELDIRG